MRQKGMCTCAVHCPENTYHEKACCEQVWCDCWCHVGKRAPEAQWQYDRRFQVEKREKAEKQS